MPSLATSSHQLYAELAVPLGSNSIRLLDLQPALTGNDESLLIGCLRVACLQDRPVFTTLSYVWGPEISSDHKITSLPHWVDLKITASCFKALQYIRKRCGAVTIWVDSICINQDDDDDKMSQIPLMQDIYSLADVGYIWLGEGNDASDFAIECLESRAKFFERLPLTYLAAVSQQQQKLEFRNFKRKLWEDMFCRLKSKSLRRLRPRGGYKSGYEIRDPTLRTSQQEFVCLQILLNNPWFRRSWTFQEVILSKNPVFLCGDKVLLWEDIINAVYVPDLSPDMTTALGYWRSLVELWLNFPRRSWQPQRRSSLDCEALYDSHSFKELINTFWAERGVPTPVALLFIVLFILATVIPLLMLNGSIYGLAKVILSIDSLIVVYFMLILTLAVYDSWWPYSYSLLNYTMFGKKQEWLVLESETENHDNVTVEILNGIWTALRKRASSEPRDKSFALSGVLTMTGAVPSPPSYSQTIEETYRNLVRDLLIWQPGALTLILDAGVQNFESGWPSWLPDWTAPEHNAWLVDQCRLVKTVQPIQHPTISGCTMTLGGQCIGSINSYCCFKRIEDANNHNQLTSALVRLIEWIWVVKSGARSLKAYKVMKSALFAVLEGLSPERRASAYPRTSRVRYGKATYRSKTERIMRKRWEAPYDYTNHLNYFMAFEAFYKIVDEAVDATAEALLAEIRSHEIAFDYLVRLVNKLVHERRCLFVLSCNMAGSGPLEMVIGDAVFLLPGVRAPVALRSQQKQDVFRLVGPVLVHGLMHGEEFREESVRNLILE